MIYQLEIKQHLAEDVASSNFLGFQDYLRPLSGSFVLGCLYPFFLSIPICLAVGSMATAPHIASMMAIPCGIMFALSGLLSAVIHHAIWACKLRQHGREAFEKQISLDMDYEPAFELCLAAASAVGKGSLEAMDEQGGKIRVRSQGDVWQRVDRYVDIALERAEDSKTIARVKSYVILPKHQVSALQLVWGKKWYELLISLDVEHNKKIVNGVAEFIDSTPDWNYRHITLDEESRWEQQLAAAS